MEGGGLSAVPLDAFPGWGQKGGGGGELPFHLPPFTRCFVASVNEELHLVSVVLGNVPFFLLKTD